jgi:flavin reductase (DIM6/NTAB) family NADH-FMN oxidoreductase RutF
MNAGATRRGFLATLATACATFRPRGLTAVDAATKGAGGPAETPRRVSLPRPGPMLPPVPAVLLTVKGRPGEPDEISVLWTFVVNGNPPQVGVSAGDEHRAGALLALHREFVLNVPVASLVEPFDRVDMSSGKVADKFALSGLTRGKATVVDAPTVEEAPIQVECRVSHTLRVPPARTVYLADVVATTVHPGACDDDGRLRVPAVEFFGMTAGSGEFYTMGRSVGHIGQTVGRKDIRY